MKISVSLLIAFIGIAVISSCSKKDSGSKNSPTDSTNNTMAAIVGTWEADSVTLTYTYSGFVVFNQDSIFTHGHSIVEIFNADSTGLLIDDTQTPADTTAGKYYFANDSLYTLYTGQTTYTSTAKYTLSNNHLTLAQAQDSLGGVVTGVLYFTKQ
ncbi:MAG TPA: hypothetical protein VK559_11490 [Ferruginibacter sp.]|nr:hypothetical protein [Ferruginibacter sp.]